MKKQLLNICAGILIGTMICCVVYAREMRHPEMHAAMQNLQAAEQSLQKASHDYGGHREKAMQLIHDAQEEIKAGLAFAKDR
ncbi:MAG: hypothetical protein WBR29_00330 [Gammaproteobacteria bacterium]